MKNRIEILWNYYCRARKKRVEEWIPGTLLATHPSGRMDVRADNGLSGGSVDPKCVRKLAVA